MHQQWRLTEEVSRLAGEPWTEYPTRVHPTLGAIARAVEQHTSASGQAALLPMAPAIVDTARVGFETSARLVALCVSTAAASVDRRPLSIEEDRMLARGREMASYTLRRVGSARVPPAPDCAADDHVEQSNGPGAWWFPILDVLRLSKRYYRRFAAPRHASAAVAVTALARDTDRDRNLRQLLRMCLRLCPSTEKGNSHLQP